LTFPSFSRSVAWIHPSSVRPNYNVCYEFQFATNSSADNPSTLSDLLKRLTTSALWILNETLDLFPPSTSPSSSSSCREIDWNLVTQNCQQLENSLKVVLEGSSAYCGLWGALISERTNSETAEAISLKSTSLFDRRPSSSSPLSSSSPSPLPVSSSVLPSDQLTSVAADALELILSQIHLLGRYYRQLSSFYCDLYLFLLNSPSEQQQQREEDPRIESVLRSLQSLMERFENLTKRFFVGWRTLIVVCGYALVNR
jgi:hypothetical protein